jgi:hypothetical protein
MGVRPPAERLASLIPTRVDPETAAWFTRTWASFAAGADAAAGPGAGPIPIASPEVKGPLLVALARAGRRLGRAPVALTDSERVGLAEAGVACAPEGWGLDECGRAALLLRGIAAIPAENQVALVSELVQHGEVREQQAVLRVLAYLPDPARLLDVATWACRTHVESVFTAIACENPFPERHFPELNWNQLVLKAIFLEVPIDRIAGLERRIGDDLVRMAASYGSERRAAGRPVPADIDRITAHRRG